jgi:signal transduction histidine kinase
VRIFNAGDLDYLSAFGNSIMAEVSRIEAFALSRAKSDFISSISHELRSPLHGILAGTELLRDTMTQTSESAMLNNIDACGNMLLDTMNHLLDYAKYVRDAFFASDSD